VKTILLADDSITIQKVVELTFSDGDYRVFCAGNGAQALRKAAEVKPDIALVDVVMPEKNGYEVCAALKQDPRTASVPVLLLVGTFEPFDARRAEQAGASGHLTKPFESHALVARVEELLAQGPVPAVSAPAGREALAPSGSGFAETRAMPRLGAQAAEAEAVRRVPPPAPLPVDPGPMRPHPAFQEPDAADGGSYVAFADLSLPEGEEIAAVSPDRYELEAEPEQETAGEETPRMEGFVPGLEMPSPAPPHRPAVQARPTAPASPAPRAQEHDSLTAPQPDGEGLSDRDLDRLADRIVRRMSDRVVREIAWEILPGVAESVVRQRIKEIEERGR
jgi:CheY-like chemotaxis protein